MKIKEILNQSRRDFTAIYECKCGHEEQGYGHDDRNFHDNVIPNMVCKSCGSVEENYRALTTKYGDDEIV